MVYQATDEIDNTEAARSEKLWYEDSETGTIHCSGPLTMFLCQLSHRNDGSVFDINRREGRPTISPYASHQVVLPASQVFREREDFLLPLRPYDIPPAYDPSERFRSPGGKKHFEMVLIRHEDIGEADFLNDLEWSVLQQWRLENHPFVHLDGDGNLNYRVIKDVWWLILTPYHVPIPNNAHWEVIDFRPSVWKPSGRMEPREVTNPITKKLVENLPGLFA
jgi:hypothetical protein